MVDWGWRVGLFWAYRGLRAYWFVLRPRTDSVHVAVWCRGRILVIRNSYRSGHSIPAGGLRRGEPPQAAALRELREEVGLDLPGDELRFATELVSRDDFKEDRGWFFEVELDEEPPLRVDRREVTWAAFLSPQELSGLDFSPRLQRFLSEHLEG
jgi:8-oxo-dGTP pyrophosphatase MutT (NUDIX family)